MIFLKKFEAIGFKSFADNTKLTFDSPMIGVVGPNGSGKSNVIDAIKWVLGEQSIKSLRGKKSDDVIFHGSTSKKPCDFAQVTLTFDNSNKQLHFEGDEISVSRKLNRGNGNNEYYINGQLTRLKDIHDVFCDTGLAKGSLGIISQGTVSWFADSKPEDRRTIFEEAAGISKYIRKKEESLRQLERTQNNLNRVSDLTKELYKDIKKLEFQANKVKEFADKKEELANLEITMLVKDITKAQNNLETATHKLSVSKNMKQDLAPKLNSLLDNLTKYKDLLTNAEIKADKYNWELENIKEKINHLQIQKSIFDNEFNYDLNSNDYLTKVNAIKSQIEIKQKELDTNNTILERNKNEYHQFLETIDELKYQDKILEQKVYDLNRYIAKTESDLDHLLTLANSKDNYQIGAKTVLENRNALTGILGSVLDFVKCESEYEKAITVALGKNTQNIIVNTNRDVKRAIDYLIANKAGVATFMPIYELESKPMRDEHYQILLQLDGFVGLANQLIKCEKKIVPVFDVLLNKTIIATDFEKAVAISQYTYKLYKVVTLDGQIIYPHGVVSGGHVKQVVDGLVSVNKKIKVLEKQLEEWQNQLKQIQQQKTKINLNIISYHAQCTQAQVNIGVYLNVTKTINDNLISLKSEFAKITNYEYTEESKDKESELATDLADLTNKLNDLNNSKEKISKELNANLVTKKELKNQIIVLEGEIDKTRNLINTSTDVIVEFTETEVSSRNFLAYAKQKLNDTYKMTVENAIATYNKPLDMSDEAAKNRIARLAKDLAYIGPINMQAIDELKEKSERYEKMHNEEIEISNAKEEILNVIKELDQKAHHDFEETIFKINEELSNTFQYLFGGGSCYIEFLDPTDILTSGINVVANPPGKNVTSLFSLSGGEKTLVALSVLFTILKVSHFPLVILDEAESALDPANVEKFGDIIASFAKSTQFIIITHREGTMLRCEKLYGTTMHQEGVTMMFQSKVKEAKQFAFDDSNSTNNKS